MKKLVSVIVPVYNIEKYLDKCIESIVSQSYDKLEIILVDDGSTDGSSKICDEWKMKDSRINVFHKKNEGVSSARNLGIQHARGEYIVFVDSDDYANKNYIEYLVKYTPEFDLISCGYYEEYLNAKIERKITEDNTSISIDEANNQIFKFNGYKGFVWNKIFKCNIIKNNNILFENNIHMCEDQLFLVNYLKFCNNVYIISDCLYNYRIRNSSVVSGNDQSKILTIFDAYKIIKNDYETSNNLCIYFLYSLIWFYYEFNKNIGKKVFCDLNLKKSKRTVFKSNRITITEKIKLFIKIYLPFIYKIRNKSRNSKLKKFE
ncbi:MAG: glycosyltransferase [Bacilli bacterium]|nr:glycosyltransferase [Bacilli bacterium]